MMFSVQSMSQLRIIATNLIFYLPILLLTYFHIYDMNFHALSNNISQVLGNNFSVWVYAT